MGQLFINIIFLCPYNFTYLAISSGKSFVESKVLNDSLLQQESLFWQQMAEKGATITTTTDTSLQ
jgi:hypothetical protein